MEKSDSILVTGGGGLLGSALASELSILGYRNLIIPTRDEMDCLAMDRVDQYFNKYRPKYVFHLASLVFGLKGNMDNQLRSFNDNTNISMNILNAAKKYEVRKIFYAGTVAGYAFPYLSVPLKEEDFWRGLPHYGEYGYAAAKRHGLMQLEVMKISGGPDYVFGIFTNLYGSKDKFNSEAGHVVPSLISKAVKSLEGSRTFDVWGNPAVTRDFLHARDAARAAILCLNCYSGMINIASGKESSMADVVEAITASLNECVSPKWLSDKPIGIPRRCVDVSKLNDLGFVPTYDLSRGIFDTVSWYMANK